MKTINVIWIVIFFCGTTILTDVPAWAGPFDDQTVTVDPAATEEGAASQEAPEVVVAGESAGQASPAPETEKEPSRDPAKPYEVGGCVEGSVGPAYVSACKSPGQDTVYEGGVRLGPLGFTKNSRGDKSRTLLAGGGRIGAVSGKLSAERVTNPNQEGATIRTKAMVGVGIPFLVKVSAGGYIDKHLPDAQK